MSALLHTIDPAGVLERMHALLDELADVDYTALADEALLELFREGERLRRRLPAVLDHPAIAEAEARGLPQTCLARSTSTFLAGLLRLDMAEAGGRVRAATAAGPRRALTGELLPPIYPALAQAQGEGVISERHAQIIRSTIEKLPDEVQDEHAAEIEEELVGYAQQFNPRNLEKLAVRLAYCYDPDGKLKDVDYREKHRGLTLSPRVDGSARLTGELTAELSEFLQVHFDALAKPRPDSDGGRDPRTAEQRRHDALLEALKLNVRAQELPSAGGVTSTIVITMTAEEFERRRGLAKTSHGALIPVPEAMRIAAAEYRLMNVVIDKTKGIIAYSSSQRLFSEAQRLARQAIDGGCTFPNCPVPAPWCEMDHLSDYAAGGPTSVANAGHACRYDNLYRKKQGWRAVQINGRVAWIPPKWIDPSQTPRYNLLHNLDPPP